MSQDSQDSQDIQNSENPDPKQVREELPKVDDFSIDIEKTDKGHEVRKTADGQTSTIETFSDEESARMYADKIERSATRFEGAAREEAIPDTYPGKGQDETAQN